MIDLFLTNGSSPPTWHRCGTTLGATCWPSSLFSDTLLYHAPCAAPAGHRGACLCPRCGALIAMGAAPMTAMQVSGRCVRELAASAVYLAALAFVAGTVTDVLPIAALSGAVYIRWGVQS